MNVYKGYLVSCTLLLLIAICQLTPIVSGGGGGVIPSYIGVENALRGMEYRKSIRIFNGGNTSAVFHLDASGEIEEWVSFYQDSNLSIQINSTTVPPYAKKLIYVKFSIPSTASNGKHSGTIYAELISRGNGSNQSIPLKIRFPVQVDVYVTGEQILDGKVNRISLKCTEVEQPVVIGVDFSNTGNVIAEPIIKVNITRDGIRIDHIVHACGPVNVGEGKYIEILWDTSNREPGRYNATMEVYLQNYRMIYRKNLSFELLPRGTLTRKGNLIDLRYEGKAVEGGMIKVIGVFENEGKVETSAKFIAEVYLDDKLIDVKESEEVIVPVGKSFSFVVYVNLTKSGKYKINGYVIYETNTTGIKTITIDVKSKGLPFDSTVVWILIILTVGMIYRKLRSK